MELDTTSPEKFGQSLRLMIQNYKVRKELLSYLEEAVAVVEIGRYRSAAVQLFCYSIEELWNALWKKSSEDISKWNTWIDQVCKALPADSKKFGVEKDRLKRINPDAFFSWHEYYTENSLLYLGMVRKFYDDNVLHSLYHACFRLRCKSAHPSGYQVGASELATMIQLCVQHLWSPDAV